MGAWDPFETLVATAKKLGGNRFGSVSDRITATLCLSSLASLIEERATSMTFGSSWLQRP